MTRFEFVLERQGYPLARARADLAAAAALSPPERRVWQDARRWEIARHHAAWNGAYRALLGGGRLPEAWDRLPIVGKDFFQRPSAECLSAGFRPSDVHEASTSGSSGVPFFFARDRYTHARTWALIGQRYAWHGLTLGSKQARFYGIPLEFWSRLRERGKDVLMNRVRFPVFDLSETRLDAYRRRIARGRFEYIYGYTNSLVEFARHLAKSGRPLSEDAPTLKVCIVTSEMCTLEDRRQLESALGIPIVNEYGASETGVIAYEDRDGLWRLSWENLYLETVDEKGRSLPPGHPGEVLITDLFNRAMPFVRYRIGDVGTLEASGPEGEVVLHRLDGRVNDTIVLPSGRKAAGLTFYYVARSLLEGAGAPREFIIRQTALDEFVFDVVSEAPLDQRAVRQIEEKMSLYLEPGLRLRVNAVPRIERPPSGKRKHFYSEVKPAAAAAAR